MVNRIRAPETPPVLVLDPEDMSPQTAEGTLQTELS